MRSTVPFTSAPAGRPMCRPRVVLARSGADANPNGMFSDVFSAALRDALQRNNYESVTDDGTARPEEP